MISPKFHKAIIAAIPKLNKYSRRYDLDEDSRQDLIQDTLCRALECKSYSPEYDCGINSWLFIIMKNIYIDKYNKSKRHMIIDKELERSMVTTVEPTIFYEFSCADIMKVLHSLPERDKPILGLFIRGYKYEKIACSLGMSLGTVKSRLFMIRKFLQSQLNLLNKC